MKRITRCTMAIVVASILVHGSANYKSGALAGRQADVVYLRMTHLGEQSHEFVAAYWHEVVRQTGAKRDSRPLG
jgi:hypothetical protein